VTVTGAGNIEEATVSLHVLHPSAAAFSILLKGPNGTLATLAEEWPMFRR
jgi:hypothetical protein